MKQQHDDFDLSNLPIGIEPTKREIKQDIRKGNVEEVSLKDIEEKINEE